MVNPSAGKGPLDVVVVFAFDDYTYATSIYSFVNSKVCRIPGSCLSYIDYMSADNSYKAMRKCWDDAKYSLPRYTTGCTKNMASGLPEAHRLINHRQNPNGIILLFSDGLKNEGDFFQGAEKYVSTVPVHTFTIQQTYNEGLRAMAANSPGGTFNSLPVSNKPGESPSFSKLLDSILNHRTDAVERLKIGFNKFKTEVYDKKPEFFEPLKKHQAPKYMVFACSDSRVCPSLTLSLEPGEAFTVRNIAAMVPPYDKNKHTGVGSAIEYAVCELKVEVIVVIGHSCCGGIKKLLSLKDGAADSSFIEDWVRIGLPAKKKVQTECASLSLDDQCTVLEKEAVNLSLKNFNTYHFVKQGVANKTLKLVGGHYDFVSGKFNTWEL